MKFITLFILLTSAYGREPAQDNPLKQCFAECRAYEEPGYALKACIEECKDKHMEAHVMNYCNSYEEDCDRDDNDGLF